MLRFLSIACFSLSLVIGSVLTIGTNSMSMSFDSMLQKYASTNFDFQQRVAGSLSQTNRTLRNFRGKVGHEITRINDDESNRAIDVSNLTGIVSIDRERGLVVAESGCTMEQLLDACLNEGLLPKVLPELRDITVGGAIVGSALESSSFRYGQFNDICTRIIVMLGNGTVTFCSRTVNQDLWLGLAGSYGTLCTILCAEIECIQVGGVLVNKNTHAKVTVSVFEDIEEGLKVMRELVYNATNTSDSSSSSSSGSISNSTGSYNSSNFAGESMSSSTGRSALDQENRIEFIDAILFDRKTGTRMKSSRHEQHKPVQSQHQQLQQQQQHNHKSSNLAMALMTTELDCDHQQSSEDICEKFHPDTPNGEFYYEKIQSIVADILQSYNKSRGVAEVDKKQKYGDTFIRETDSETPTCCGVQCLNIPIKEFLFRYDRGAFWMAQPIKFSPGLVLRSPLLVPLFIMTHNNPLCRFLFRKLFTTRILYKLLKKAHPTIIAQRMVIMDIYVSIGKVAELLHYIQANIPISTPLWLCPVIRPRPINHDMESQQPFSPHGVYYFNPKHEYAHTHTYNTETDENAETDAVVVAEASSSNSSSSDSSTNSDNSVECSADRGKFNFMVDVGVYGRVPDGRGVDYTRMLDAWTILHDARKMLYSQQAFSEPEFWRSGDQQQQQQHDHNNMRNQPQEQRGLVTTEELLRSKTPLDKTLYDALRLKYAAEGVFPDLYQKLCGGQKHYDDQQQQQKCDADVHNVVKNGFRLSRLCGNMLRSPIVVCSRIRRFSRWFLSYLLL